MVQKINQVKKINRGGWTGFGTTTVGIDPNTFEVLNGHPNKIPTDKILGGVVQNCHNLVELIGTGSLLINLEVDIRQEEGWIEEVEWKMQDNEYLQSNQSWTLAEAQCGLGGGRLVYGFICQYDPAKANHSLSLSLTREKLNFHAFQVWYKFRAPTNLTLLNDWTQRRMTGFKLSWRIENPSTLSASVSEPGMRVQTPMFGGTFDPEYFERDHTYIATLEFPDDLTERVGNGSLTIEIEVDLREEEDVDWVENIEYEFGGLPKYQLFLKRDEKLGRGRS